MARTKGPSADFRPRLDPPATLTKPQAAIFRQVCRSVASDHFQRCDLTLIGEFARAADLANQAAAALAEHGPVTPDNKLSPWVTTQEKAQRALVAIAARLRLSPQHRLDKTVAGRTSRDQAEWIDDGDNDGLIAKPQGLRHFRVRR